MSGHVTTQPVFCWQLWKVRSELVLKLEPHITRGTTSLAITHDYKLHWKHAFKDKSYIGQQYSHNHDLNWIQNYAISDQYDHSDTSSR